MPYVLNGNLLEVSGQISEAVAGVAVTAKLGVDVAVAGGWTPAELCALSILAQVRAAVGVLGRFARSVRLNAFVNSASGNHRSTPGRQQTSNLIATVPGDKGKHHRIAFGVAALPLGVAVEIDAITHVYFVRLQHC